MPKKGQRKYECADCGETIFLWRRELSRRCKPRCRGCGATFLVESSAPAKRDAMDGHEAYTAYRDLVAERCGKVRP